jgi:phosphoribosylamine--glycine ligase
LKVFHSGTELNVNGLVTNGGRVLSVSGLGQDKVSARNMVYEAISRIDFNGKHYRKDIGLLEARNSNKVTKKDKT